ncbi:MULTISPECIES: hypothetical protein [Empedobacter]|uniref:Uncharacterized protein n=1 Tax=Empedobacter falsenii TaxID=343874 RepID=A0A376G1H3_9FLAO|nr:MULTISPECIES: hypothetical protein [Empedobacter]MDH1883781.1 hypothetical protein [Empedobacter sp. GD03797]MDH2208228.1 hypothetical protein [Empedobacter sp. GD03644]MDM1552789.1 hypothetical protein [Empedobacter falsenii]QLL57069.1 hypothetical protein FH779_02735 [Empedobacter falsenii]STD54465.1 Uncharacterised protein [Empedobacter falsenii]
MFESQLKLFTQSYDDAIFYNNDAKVDGTIGAKLHLSYYYIDIPYKNCLIYVEQELGNHNLGKIRVTLDKISLPIFTITNINHLVNLFLRKKQILKVDCSNESFKHYLQNLLIETNLEKIAKDNLFEPKISSKIEGENLVIETIYHLEFEEKIEALKALIEFYKKLISY